MDWVQNEFETKLFWRKDKKDNKWKVREEPQKPVKLKKKTKPIDELSLSQHSNSSCATESSLLDCCIPYNLSRKTKKYYKKYEKFCVQKDAYDELYEPPLFYTVEYNEFYCPDYCCLGITDYTFLNYLDYDERYTEQYDGEIFKYIENDIYLAEYDYELIKKTKGEQIRGISEKYCMNLLHPNKVEKFLEANDIEELTEFFNK